MKDKFPVYSKSISNKLKRELELRQARNSSYSIRAFARDMKTSVSALHDYINGKKYPSTAKIRSLCKLLKVSDAETLELTTPVDEISKTSGILGSLPDQDDEHQADLNIVNSDIYHLAYLGLDNLNSFENNLSWISKKLNLTEEKVVEIQSRLCRVGLLEEKEKGVFERDAEHRKLTNTKSKRDVEKSKRLHHQNYLLTESSLDNHEREDLSHSLMIFPVNKDRIEEARELIVNFRRELASRMSQSENPDDLYALAITLNPIT